MDRVTEKSIFKAVEPSLTANLTGEDYSQVIGGTQRLLDVLNSLFPYQELTPKGGSAWDPGRYLKDPEERARTALTNLIGSNKTRIGAEPNEVAKQQMMTAVLTAVQRDLPIQLMTVWGTPRDINNPGINSAELADFSALSMLNAAVERIRAVHKPGAIVRATEEDVVCEWLDVKNPDDPKEAARAQEEFDRYWETKNKMLYAMIHSTGNGMPIELARESEVLKRMQYSKERFLADCQALEPKFVNYLKDSDAIMDRYLRSKGYNSWDEAATGENSHYPNFWAEIEKSLVQLDSYTELQKSGWIGTISPEMRYFYSKKYVNIRPELAQDSEALRKAIAHYLASTCRRANIGTLTYGLQFPETMVKVPLTLAPTGRPEAFNALVQLRSIPKISGLSAPECVAPWLGTSYLDMDNGLLTVGNPRKQDPDARLVPVQAVLRNDPVQSGRLSISYPIPSQIKLSR